MMFFDPNITLVFRDLLPWAGELFRVITELGSEYFYIGLILVGFWTFKKRESIILAIVLLIGFVSNYILKTMIANPRPDPSYWYPGVEEVNYSTPSNHAQLAATLYSWFSLKIRTWWMLLISIILPFLIGISRIYLGVHYLEDVILGWAVGIGVAILLFYLQEPLANQFTKYKEEYLYTSMFFLGLILTILLTYVFLPPSDDNFGSTGGLIMGAAVGLYLEKRYVNFDVEPNSGQKWRLVLRALLGLIFVVLLLFGLGPLLPSEEIWLRTLRYTIVVIFGVFLWPLIFKKIGL
ncbi:MAG: phosphatase PAP2 family protein [Candidatus Thorarchaeota archaeon]